MLLMNKKLKETARRLPLVLSVYRSLRTRFFRYRLSGKNSEELFTEIYQNSLWQTAMGSISGTGSDPDQTKRIVEVLPLLLEELEVSRFLDVPCGDFSWMQNIDLAQIEYIGADIVEALIHENISRYQSESRKFLCVDLLADQLPRVDLVMCRDCLVHLSYEDILLALTNILRSESKYLLTTTFVGRNDNYDIATGQWRALDLESHPFEFGKPLRVLNEQCTERDGDYSDKSLAVWRVTDLFEYLKRFRSNLGLEN